jgi:hypothetical protein
MEADGFDKFDPSSKIYQTPAQLHNLALSVFCFRYNNAYQVDTA